MSHRQPAVSKEVDIPGDKSGIAWASVEALDRHLVSVLLQDVLHNPGSREGLIPTVEGTNGDVLLAVGLHGSGVLRPMTRGAIGPLRVDVVRTDVGATGFPVSTVSGTTPR